jgi:dienelactone hydrolase
MAWCEGNGVEGGDLDQAQAQRGELGGGERLRAHHRGWLCRSLQQHGGTRMSTIQVKATDEDEFLPVDGRAKAVAATRGHANIAAYVYPHANHAFARVGGVHRDARFATTANGRSTEALGAALG